MTSLQTEAYFTIYFNQKINKSNKFICKCILIILKIKMPKANAHIIHI